jgi:putative ABC transport system permease protein
MVGGEQREMPIAGLTHDLSLPPAPIAGKAFGYISFETLEWLGGPESYDDIYNQIKIVVAERPTEEGHIWNVATLVEDKIERSGREVGVIDVPTPQQHPAEVVIPTILAILGILGGMALLLGAFLIVNTIEAILSQQIKQIGILKAVGTSNQQIMALYFGMVLSFGVLALLLAVPLGTLGALGFTRFMASQLNIDIADFGMPGYVIVLKATAALLIPVLVALPAIRSAVSITVREALSSSGTSAEDGDNSLINRIFQHIRGLPRPVLLSLRNTFRRKARLLRTLFVLALGGAIFISVLSVRASLVQSLDETLESKLYDIEVRLARPYRIEYIEQHVLALPGVVAVESWGFSPAYPIRPDGSEGEEINVFAMPAGTDMLELPMQQGRWLLPEDNRAIVLTSNYLNKEPGTQVGDEIVLDIGEEESTWRIVGISKEFVSPVNPATGYVHYEELASELHGLSGRTTSLRVRTTRHDPAFHEQVAQVLEARADEQNIRVSLIQSLSEERAILSERFNILTAVLSMMATLIAIVGGLGLMGTMSINVLERTKEIGIMRAIGASDGAVQQIVIVEGVLIGLISWLLAVLLSLPLSRVMSSRIGINLLNQPLSFHYALYAVLVWLVVVVVVATVASYMPARNASRLTIREVLAYE